MQDPYGEMIGKRIEVKELDGQISRGVLHTISYNYISLRHPWVVVTRRNIASIKEIPHE